ncbi:hypothetical protein HGRIS_005473 [Hohenbuehelia grisea]|uniref:Uncharacterized protein n=1 Tax=Hohenbuehelia grisea TaxID=104357 RepID=A0ABR3JZ05_9AGAR
MATPPRANGNGVPQAEGSVYAVIGGDQPGVQTRGRPFIMYTSKDPFPLAIRAPSLELGDDAMDIHRLIRDFGYQRSTEDIIHFLYHSGAAGNVLRQIKPWYAVYNGTKTRNFIFYNFNTDVEPIVKDQRFARFQGFDRLVDAVIYLLLCGNSKEQNERFSPVQDPRVGTNYRLFGEPTTPPRVQAPANAVAIRPQRAAEQPARRNPPIAAIAGTSQRFEDDFVPEGEPAASRFWCCLSINTLAAIRAFGRLGVADAGNRETAEIQPALNPAQDEHRMQVDPAIPQAAVVAGTRISRFIRDLDLPLLFSAGDIAQPRYPHVQLNAVADLYLRTHGYQNSAVLKILSVFGESADARTFATRMSQYGPCFAFEEMIFLHRVLSFDSPPKN